MSLNIAKIKDWFKSSRWDRTKRDHTAEDVAKLRGSYKIEYTLAKLGAQRLWDLLEYKAPVRALGALTGNQAIQQVKAGLKAIYLSGWQVAADNNLSGNMYPDQSLYPCNSVPNLVSSLNKALLRADQVDFIKGDKDVHWLAPIVADAEAGFGGSLNAYEMMKAMVEAGAAGVHFEDQLSSAKKCGHLGGKVLVSVGEFINKLKAARLAADVMGVPTILIARTDANSAKLLTSNIDVRDQGWIQNGGDRTQEGFYRIRGGLDMAIARALQYAPYADLLWCETSKPDLKEAEAFAQAIHDVYPDQMLAYNCSPSFNWSANVSKTGPLEDFHYKLDEMGYIFQFITLAGFHSLNTSMYELATAYQRSGMPAYAQLQDREFELVKGGFGAVKHQSFVGTGYFDMVSKTISSSSSTTAMDGSTETEQF